MTGNPHTLQHYFILVRARVVPLAFALACGGPTTPGEGTTTEIAYWGEIPSGPGLYLVNTDGTNARLVTPTDGYLACLSWSPDGRHIAFARSNGSELVYQLWIADVETRSEVRLTFGPDEHTCPAWSPDGLELAYFFRHNFGDYLLHLIKPDGSDDRQVSTTPLSPSRAAWAPDSKRLAVVTQHFFAQVAILDVVTGTVGPPLTSLETSNLSPIWSPTGEMIALASQRPDGSGVFVIRPDGTEVFRISYGGTYPSWSPDARWIAFERDGAGPNGEPGILATSVDADTTTTLVVLRARQPAWRPQHAK